MNRTDGLVRSGEAACRVLRAAPEDGAGAASAAGRQVAFATRRAGGIKRQRRRRRRSLLLDVVALGIPPAAHERAESAAALNEYTALGFAALRAGLGRSRFSGTIDCALAGCLGGIADARQLAGLFVLGVHRTGQELSVAAKPDDHRVPLRAQFV